MWAKLSYVGNDFIRNMELNVSIFWILLIIVVLNSEKYNFCFLK